MARWVQYIFWGQVALIGYAYLGYAVLLAGLLRWRRRGVNRSAGCRPSVSVVLAAYNEEGSIGRRVGEFLGKLDAEGIEGEVIVVSDGSTDRTAEVARAVAEGTAGRGRVRVIEQPGNLGKAAALTAGCAAAVKECVVLADARQTWAEDAMGLLLENFADPAVGAVSGDLVIADEAGVLQGVGLYWRYEKWLRRAESETGSMAGVTGAICAVRRGLFRPLPTGTILDDVYWPLGVAMAGYRVVHDGRAKAFDRLPGRAKDEFRRKVRTLSGNYQLVALRPAVLLPWRNPVWGRLVSHKLLRLAVPWLMVSLLLMNVALLRSEWIYGVTLAAQVVGYSIAAMGMSPTVASRSRLASAGASFLILNAAAAVALWVWASGRATRSWHKTRYADDAGSAANDPNRGHVTSVVSR